MPYLGEGSKIPVMETFCTENGIFLTEKGAANFKTSGAWCNCKDQNTYRILNLPDYLFPRLKLLHVCGNGERDYRSQEHSAWDGHSDCRTLGGPT